MSAKLPIVRRVIKAIAKASRFLLPRNRWGDKLYATIKFAADHGRLPGDRMIFNDVLYRIKTSDEILDPLRVFVSDKELAKLFIRATVGEEFNVPTLAVLHSLEEVRSYRFPDNCFVKPTHASGRYLKKTATEPFDREAIGAWLKVDYYKKSREANYRSLRPKIIVEPIVFQDLDYLEYRVFCYRGKPKLIIQSFDKLTGLKRRLYDRDWNFLPFTISNPISPVVADKPVAFDLMMELSGKLSARFEFIRIDFYEHSGKIMVGEITNIHAGAAGKFIPLSAEETASRIIFG